MNTLISSGSVTVCCQFMSLFSSIFMLLQAFRLYVCVNQILDLISQSRCIELRWQILFFLKQQALRFFPHEERHENDDTNKHPDHPQEPAPNVFFGKF